MLSRGPMFKKKQLQPKKKPETSDLNLHKKWNEILSTLTELPYYFIVLSRSEWIHHVIP